MIEIFVVGCVITIALYLAVFERKNVVKGDEVVSIGPGHWTVPNGDQKLGDTSSGSSDESDPESEDENQQQIAKQDYARCVQLRLHRFGEYRTRKEVNDLLILLVYYYTVIIKVLGVLLSNQSKEQLGIVRNVSTVTLYKEEEEFPLDDQLPESIPKKKKVKNEKQAEEVYMPICLRKNDEAMYHEASIDNLDILITQRQKIESYISHLSESDVDIVKAVPAAIEKQPSITYDESNVLFNVSIENNNKEDAYEPLIKKDAIISDIESLQAHIGDPKDDVNNELESLKTKLGCDLTQKIKPESSIDESDASMPTLKSMSIDDSDLDVSSSHITESEVVSTDVESFPDKTNTVLVDKESVIPIVDLIEKVEKDNDQTPGQAVVYENSYHTGAIPKYSHPDTSKSVPTDQTSNSVAPVVQVESFKETEKTISEADSLICESKPIDTQETSKAEIVKLKSIEKDILDGSEDEDLEEDTEDSDVSIPDMKGSYTLHHEDYGVEEIYEDRDPLDFLLEGNEVEDDLSENFVDSFFSDESVPCAPVPDTTYQIDPILEEESEEDYSEQDDTPGPLQLKVPTLIEDKFAMTFSKAVDEDENIDQSQSQSDEKIPDIDIEEKKQTEDINSHIDIHNYQNGNKQKEVLHKIKDLADKLDEIKNQELNVDCTIVEDITEDVVTIELDNNLDIYGDEPCNSKLEQCKAFNLNDTLDIELDNKEFTKESIENGILSSKTDGDVSSIQSEFQDCNANEKIEIVNNNIELNENSIETNYAEESENICIGDGNEMAIEFDTPDVHFNEVKSNYVKKNEDDLSIGDMNEMAIEFETPDINSNEVNYNYAENNEDIRFNGDNNEMAIEFETPDMHFNEIKLSDHNSDIINNIDELSVKISSELPSKDTIFDKHDQNAIHLEIDQRTSSDIDNSLVSDKSEQLFSEQGSVKSFDKGEEVLLDINEDQEYSSIDRCEAFSADAEPPEDFEYEGEAEYQKTVKLENFKNLENLQAAVVSSDECSHKIVLDVHEFRHGDLRVSAVGETEILVEAVSEVPEHEAMQVRKFRQKFLLPETAAATDSIAALSSDGVLAIITPKKDGTSSSIKRKLPEDVETPEKSSKYMTKHDPRSNETEKSTIIDREMVECFMPILQRGNFFTDSIFQETRQDFNTAITEVLDKWGERSVHDPERGTHREEPKEDNQILVDIADFTNDGEVKINVMDEELVVEGRTKKAEGSATSVKTFIRRFTLAPDIDPSAVTSVVTPDGILEITTPKKTVMPKLKEFSIQVIIELIVEESRTSPRKDSKSRKKLKDKSPGKDTDSSHSRKKKKIPEDGESEDYQNQAAGITCDDDLFNKAISENETLKSFEVSELMAQKGSNTGEDIKTGASKEGIEDSLGVKSSVTDENYDQQIIASRDDENSDESDESQQTTESVDSEPQVHITDIKRFILESHREFGSDDEAQQSITLDTTDKSTPLENKEESQQAIAGNDEINVQRKTLADLDSNVSFDEEDDSDWTLITPKEKSVLFQKPKCEKQDEQEEICESNVKSGIENISSKESNAIDESQDFDFLKDAPSKHNMIDISSQEDFNPIPVILNGNAQKDGYEVGGDFRKLLSSFPEHLELQSQDSTIEKENNIPTPRSHENESKGNKPEKVDPIIKVEKRTTKSQKDKEISYQTKKMDHDNKIIDTKYISDTKEVKLPEAYITLATNDDYAVGALVLGHSLHAVGTTRKLAIMITEAVSLEIRPMLHDVFNDVIIVNVMDSRDSAHLAQLKRPELGVTFTKLHCWTLLQYSKCVFLDADMFVLQNPDDLFGYPELSAAPDVGWPDCFNSGMFVFVPNTWTYHRLLQHAATTGSFDGGDQGVLNTFFPKWNCISFIYNMVASAVYTYIPAYMNYGGKAKIVHFIGPSKPWHQNFDKRTGEVETAQGYHHLRGFLSSWWKLYSSLVEPGILNISMARRILMERSLERSPGFGDTQGFVGSEHGDTQGFARWEYGAPDYLGQDSYMNIQAHIDNKISQYELSNKKKTSTKKQNLTDSTTNEDKDRRKDYTDGDSQEKLSMSSQLSGNIFKKNNEIEEQVQEIMEVPENNKFSMKAEELKQTPNLEKEKSQKEGEESDWVLVKSRRRKQSERNSESFEEQQPESTDKNEKYSMNSESYLPSKPELVAEKIEDIARIEKRSDDKKSSRNEKSKTNQKANKKYDTLDTSTTEVSSINKTPSLTDFGQSTPSYSDILSRKIKDTNDSQGTSEKNVQDFEQSEDKLGKGNKNDVQATENLKQYDVHSSKYPELEIEETTYWPEKRPYWNIKATPKESEYSSAFKRRELKSDEIETKSPKPNLSFKPKENNDFSSEVDSSTSQDTKPMSVRSKTKTIKDDKDLIKESQTHSRKIDKDIDLEIDESKIWEMASLRYLGPKDVTVTQADNINQKDHLNKQKNTKESPIVKSQTIEESHIPRPTELGKDIKETSSPIEAKLSTSGDADKYESLYSKYSITSSGKGTSHQKSSEISEDKNYNEPNISRKQEENIDISNRNRKLHEPTNISSNNDWESLLSSLDKKLDFATNLLNIPSSEMISGMAASDTATMGLSVPCEVDDTTKVYEKDDLSPSIKRKIEVHPEDAMKHDEKQQDAKHQQEQTQELMQQAWDADTSSGTITGVSEANKNKISSAEIQKITEIKEHTHQADVSESQLSENNSTPQAENKTKLSSDEAKSVEAEAVSQKKAKASKVKGSKEAKSLEAKAGSQKESKASELEGSKDKLPSTSKCMAEVSEVSQDTATKESGNLEKKQTAQDEASKQLTNQAEKDALSKSPSTKEQQENATSESSVAGEPKSTTEQQKLATVESSAAGEPKSTAEQQKLATAEGSVAGEPMLTNEQQKLASAESSVAGENKLTTEQQKLASAESSAAGENKLTAEQQKLASAESSVAGENKLTAEQQKLATAESSVAGENKLTAEEQKLATVESSVTGENKLTAEQQKLATAESSAAGKNKLTAEQQKLATAESSAAGKNKLTAEEQKLATVESSISGENMLTAEQQKLATAESPVAGKNKITAEQQKLVSAESSVAGEPKLTDEQQKLATAESYVAGENKLTAEQQKLATAESSVAGEDKLTAEQQKLASAESSVAGEPKLTDEQQKLATAERSVAGENKLTAEQQKFTTEESSIAGDLKSTTEQQKLDTAKDLQSKEDSLKPKSSADISKQSTSEESGKAELSSSQRIEKDTSTAKKSVKEKTEKDVSDESVRSKKSTVKKDVSEKPDSVSGKSSSTAKPDIQISSSSSKKEEEKSISPKDAKALFQSQTPAAAAGSTSDLRSAGRPTSSLGLSGTRSMSSSYSTLPGSSSPSSGYLATGTKSIASGSFTFKATEEYIKKKPPPRNRPFFNLRDFL